MNEPKSFDRVKKNWEGQIKKIVDKVENAKDLTSQKIIHDLSRLEPGFCKEVRIERCQMIGNTGLSVFFDKPFAPFGIRLETLTPLAVSVINFFAKESIALTDRSFLLQPYVDILTRIDKSVLFNPPNDNILKVFCNFISKNGLDRYPIPKIDHKRYNDFSVLTTVPVLKNSRKWFFPKGIRINDLANVILATGELPKTRTEACRFYKKLKLIEPTITRNERI